MKILVLGIPKTGTTFAYYLLKIFLPKDYDCFFEPLHHHNWHTQISKCDQALVKDLFVLEKNFDYYQKSYAKFPIRISIVRDPRDRILSSFFFCLANGSFKQRNISINYKKVRQQIIRKIANPDIPFVTILEELGFTKEEILHNFNVYKSYIRFLSSFDSIKIYYESLVDGMYENLEKSIGIQITNSQIDTYDHKIVARTMSYGDWRNWFTPSDVVFFRRHYQELLSELGYDEDWQLNENQTISQEYTIEYLDKWNKN